ncbi:hypothetical protein Bbelb_050560 [Branchiostoma belcheri]|nr:hypothetical protein Bbelb_050560 [Branchiostoma belcheri]
MDQDSVFRMFDVGDIERHGVSKGYLDTTADCKKLRRRPQQNISKDNRTQGVMEKSQQEISQLTTEHRPRIGHRENGISAAKVDFAQWLHSSSDLWEMDSTAAVHCGIQDNISTTKDLSCGLQLKDLVEHFTRDTSIDINSNTFAKILNHEFKGKFQKRRLGSGRITHYAGLCVVKSQSPDQKTVVGPTPSKDGSSIIKSQSPDQKTVVGPTPSKDGSSIIDDSSQSHLAPFVDTPSPETDLDKLYNFGKKLVDTSYFNISLVADKDLKETPICQTVDSRPLNGQAVALGPVLQEGDASPPPNPLFFYPAQWSSGGIRASSTGGGCQPPTQPTVFLSRPVVKRGQAVALGPVLQEGDASPPPNPLFFYPAQWSSGGIKASSTGGGWQPPLPTHCFSIPPSGQAVALGPVLQEGDASPPPNPLFFYPAQWSSGGIKASSTGGGCQPPSQPTVFLSRPVVKRGQAVALRPVLQEGDASPHPTHCFSIPPSGQAVALGPVLQEGDASPPPNPLFFYPAQWSSGGIKASSTGGGWQPPLPTHCFSIPPSGQAVALGPVLQEGDASPPPNPLFFYPAQWSSGGIKASSTGGGCQPPSQPTVFLSRPVVKRGQAVALGPVLQEGDASPPPNPLFFYPAQWSSGGIRASSTGGGCQPPSQPTVFLSRPVVKRWQTNST